MPIDKVLAALKGARPAGKGKWSARCPGHEDSHASLSVATGSDDRVLIKCHAGCETESVVAAMGVTMADLMPARGQASQWQASRPKKVAVREFKSVEDAVESALATLNRSPGSRWGLTATFVYRDVAGVELLLMLRFDREDGSEKSFRPVHQFEGKWRLGDPPRPLPLYRLAELQPGYSVIVCEGEKCADMFASLGFRATTSAHGASSAKKTDWAPLAGFDVAIFPDNDEPGHKYAADVSMALSGLNAPARVRLVDLPGLEEGGDIADYVAAREREGMTRPEIAALVQELIDKATLYVPPVTAEAAQPADLLSSKSFMSSPSGPATATPPPAPLAAAAFYGLAGDFVRLVEPHSEADPAALLLQFLAAIGNVVGRGPFYRVEGDYHYPGLFVVIVGRTSKGRKGTSWGQVRAFIQLVDEEWIKNCQQTGLSSGEGLIWAVRDPIRRMVPDSKKPGAAMVEAVVDAGVDDKRCNVVEGEFASTLRVLQRDGNTLSAVVRNAWDSGKLKILTKNSPATATDAHISIIGHITKDEALRYLDRTEFGNGFGNRFLWAFASRSKLLPFGGTVPEYDLAQLAARAVTCVRRAKGIGRVVFDADASAIWKAEYGALSEGKAGLLGAMTARAEAQVIRLALIYAILDGSEEIRAMHLQAALAVWRYCEESAAYVFGDAVGDPVADAILAALRSNPDGLDRTALRDLFSRNKSGNEVGRALAALLQAGLAVSRQIPTGGRPQELWLATTKTTNTTKGQAAAAAPQRAHDTGKRSASPASPTPEPAAPDAEGIADAYEEEF